MKNRADLYDGCPSSHALDLIGERWLLLIVRDLLLGPKRFTDLLRGLPRISRTVLSQRLDHLEAAGVVARRKLPPPSGAAVYELTARGEELETVLEAIGRWGAESSQLPVSQTLGADTFILGLRHNYDPGRAKGLTASYEARIGDDVFSFDILECELAVRRGGCGSPTVVFEADPGALYAVARGALPLAAALTVVGPAGVSEEARDQAANRFLMLFALPSLSA